MISTLKRDKWFLVKVIVFVTIAIPIGITTYELIILGKDTVVFLEDYPEAVSIMIMLYYATLLAFGIIWVIIQLKSLLKLKNEKTKNELLHLQSQVNPHFFFNMLNNLYGLVDVDAKKAKQLILKLSELMRYSIYEGEKKTVPLEEEVSYLKNYIELHRMRYHKDIDIRCDIKIEENNYQIVPLLFIILLENAFKHGVENLKEKAYVYMSLTAKNENISFEIENNFDATELPKTSGLGIQNLTRRLELAYPKKHNLTFTDDVSIYKAHLELQL